jgi:hypothetical protein|tara:strand:- start:674 stop:856 length:183 start_codon:yes stop_codon:yes gene_type:complete
MDNYTEDMMILPDPLVTRTEQVRKLVKDLKDSDDLQIPLLLEAIAILLNSCEPKRFQVTH